MNNFNTKLNNNIVLKVDAVYIYILIIIGIITILIYIAKKILESSVIQINIITIHIYMLDKPHRLKHVKLVMFSKFSVIHSQNMLTCTVVQEDIG